MKRALAAALFLSAAAVSAQEIDVFDINDFVNPRQLGAVVRPNGALACPCNQALVATLVGGGVHDYVDGLRPTGADVRFAHLATSYYAGLWQVNVKATAFENESTVEVPARKYSLQLGRYYAFGHNDPPVLRAQLNYSRIEYRRTTAGSSIAPATAYNAYDRELGAEIDVSFRRFAGSFVYLDDQPPGHGHGGAAPLHRTRIGFNHRLPRWNVGGFGVDVSAAAGVYRYRDRAPQPPELPPVIISPPPPPPPVVPATNWTRLTFFPSVEVTSPSIPKLDLRVHVRYEPRVQQIPGSWQTSHQVSVFIDRVLIAKVF